MPIITKTVSGNPENTGYYLHINALNMAKAVASAIGGSYKETANRLIRPDEPYSNKKTYYVPMEPIGYQDFCLFFETLIDQNGEWEFASGIITTGEAEGTNKDNNKIYNLWTITGLANNTDPYNETCVMIHDDSYDTVLFDIHHGSTLHGTDLSYSNDRDVFLEYTLFFARDVKNNVLCGCGMWSVNRIRTLSNSASFQGDATAKKAQKTSNLSSVLHLCKMVNYLDPDLPEMKSAYVSVSRPEEDSSDKKLVSLNSINGIRFGKTGGIDSWDSHDVAAKHISCSYFPIDPYVAY